MGTFMETQLRFLVFSRGDKVDKEKLNYEKTQSDRRKPSPNSKRQIENGTDACEQRRERKIGENNCTILKFGLELFSCLESSWRF